MLLHGVSTYMQRSLSIGFSEGLNWGRLPQEANEEMMSCRSQYGIPSNYNPDDHPAVRMRSHNSSDQSETQRKRRSKNRLSNRRSTGFISQDQVEEAVRLGADAKEPDNGQKP